MSLNQHVSGQLFGYSTLPEASGPWGILLPRPGDKSESSAADAQDVVLDINDERITFYAGHRVSDRGFLFMFLAPLAMIMSGFVLSIPGISLHPTTPAYLPYALMAFIGSISGAVGFAAYRSARKPLPPPVYISRTLRKVLAWQEKTKSWLALDYDSVVPVTFPYRMITTSGSATLYALTLHQLKPGTREVVQAITPTPLRGTPEECRANWEFIRGYMDGKPEDLPPIRLVPSTQNPKAWMARTDRTVFGGLIDDEHRINPKHLLFGNFVVYFWGMVSYWGERAAGWIERTAPRAPLPDWLPKVTASEPGTSPYKVIAPTPTQLQAQEGTLPHLRRRWLICGVLSTALWTFMFGSLVVRLWLLGR